jgi:peptidoglycan hydrolase-like protein with peptidoglycan-binding domain
VKLAQLGFYNGPVDGILGQTTEAIIAYQQSQNLEATGQINAALLDALGIKRS